MMITTKGSFSYFISLFILLSLSLACNMPGAPTAPASLPSEQCFDSFTNDGSFFTLDGETIKNDLVQAGFNVSEVTAIGEGEYITSSCPSTPAQPSIRSTSLTITILNDALNDTDALGKLSGQLLDSLEQLPYTSAPQWQAGTTTFIFQSGADQVQVSFSGSYAVQMLRKEQNLDGSALWNGLNDRPCVSTTADEELPELTAQLQAAVQKAGLTDVTMTAQASVTTCTDPDSSNTVEKTSIGATTFNINIVATNPDDEEALGNQAAQALAVLATVPFNNQPDSTQDPSIQNTIEFSFGVHGYIISYNTGMKAVEDGLKGKELIDLLTTSF